MNFGLVGWAVASGNGGMNSDIASLASWVTHWLIPVHPKLSNHQPYLENKITTKLMHCRLAGDEDIYRNFLDDVDGIIYVEHPCLRDNFDIVEYAKKIGKLVVAIPMWEWWPERKPWVMQTDILWAVTPFTNRYLKSLSDVLYVHGWKHCWRNHVIGDRWGVNLADFPFRQRTEVKNFVFVNGNGGYKMRKASDVVFEAFSMPGAPPLTVYTQQTETIAKNISDNITIIDRNFPARKDVYDDGDVFLFTSFWEGLCHGIYEGQAVGGLVVTTDHPPMNECGTPFLVPIKELQQEDLAGKKIVKAVPSANLLNEYAKAMANCDIHEFSKNARINIENNYDLEKNLRVLYQEIKVIQQMKNV